MICKIDRNGEMKILSETGLESYALKKWLEENEDNLRGKMLFDFNDQRIIDKPPNQCEK